MPKSKSANARNTSPANTITRSASEPASPFSRWLAPTHHSGNHDLAYASDADSGKPEYDLGTRLHLDATITEKAVHILHEQDPALAEMLFETNAES